MKRFLYILFGIGLSFLLLLTALETASFRLETYRQLDQEYQIQARSHMDAKNLEATMTDLLQYLSDNRTVLDTRAVIAGSERAVFNEREIQHMVDVKALFSLASFGQFLSGFVVVALLTYFLLKKRLKTKGFALTLLFTAGINVILFAILGLLIQTDFTQYFTYFHELFFSNDLWLLNPRTDVLIQMLPEPVFVTIATQIALLYAGCMFIIACIGGVLFYRVRKQN